MIKFYAISTKIDAITLKNIHNFSGTFEINFFRSVIHLYHFLIHFDENSATNVIASLLQMDEIKRCSKVKIGIEIDNGILHLPIEEISNWLERYIDGIENNVQNRDVRFFKFGFYDIQIQNCREMIEHLIMVFCI